MRTLSATERRFGARAVELAIGVLYTCPLYRSSPTARFFPKFSAAEFDTKLATPIAAGKMTKEDAANMAAIKKAKLGGK